MTKVLASYVCKLSLTSLQTQKVSHLRARPGGFPIALWAPSVPMLVKLLQVRGPKIHFLSVPMKNAACFSMLSLASGRLSVSKSGGSHFFEEATSVNQRLSKFVRN